MLRKSKTLILTATSQIDGVEAISFQAQINSADPQNMTITNWQVNPHIYKENRDICRADQAAFEDDCYRIQDEMLANVVETEQEETTETEVIEE